MTALTKKLRKTRHSMIGSAEALCDAGHVLQGEEMQGAAAMLKEWIDNIEQEAEDAETA